LARYYYVRRDAKSGRANALDYCNLFPIARLPYLYVGASFRVCNDYPVGDYAYLETGLVKVVDVGVYHAVFGDHVPHKAKPRVYRIGIFVLGPLVVVLAKETRSELWSSINEPRGLVGPDAWRVALRE
jgi:hypothetical protein